MMDETKTQGRQAAAQHHVLRPQDFAPERKRGIGLVVPYDFALDMECWRWLPADTPLYITRTSELNDNTVSPEQARGVSDPATVRPAVRSLLPAQPAAIGYACTSGSFVDGREGEQKLTQVMRDAGAPHAVTTSGALVEALTYLKVRRVAIATPYNAELTGLLEHYLQTCGFDVTSSSYLDMEMNIAQVTYDAVRAMATAVDRLEADAVFFSCTNLTTFDIIEELEALLRKPVLSANQVTMWATLRAGNFVLPRLPQKLFLTENSLTRGTDQ